MAGFDPDVFGAGGQQGAAFDADVFNAPSQPLDLSAPAAPPASKPGFYSRILQGDIAGAVKDDLQAIPGRVGNLVAGGIKGATNIGATLLSPLDALTGRTDRREQVTGALTGMGADPNSPQFKVGTTGVEIAGTSGIPKLLSMGAQAVRSAPAIVQGLASGGFNVAGATGLPGWLARLGTGAGAGGMTAGLADPDNAVRGATVGALMPAAVRAAGSAGDAVSKAMESGARTLMQSAIKPTIAQRKSGDAATAIDVLLQRGISPTVKGVEKLQGLVDDTDQQIGNVIAGSTAQVDKSKVLQALGQTRGQFGMQATPQNDLAAIQAAEDAFRAHPQFPGQTIPIQQAQDLKRGTYRVLNGKFGEQGSASTEAQKALARGLKEQIAALEPQVSPLNAELSRLIVAKEVAERRALLEGNKNPFGLSALAPSPAGLLAFMADRSAAAKAMTARGLFSAAPGAGKFGLLGDPLLLPGVRAGLLVGGGGP